jgi:hypothetical protein
MLDSEKAGKGYGKFPWRIGYRDTGGIASAVMQGGCNGGNW